MKSKIFVGLHELSVSGKMYLSEKSCFRPLQKHGTHGAPAKGNNMDPLRSGKHYCESLHASPSTTSTWKFQFDELRALK